MVSDSSHLAYLVHTFDEYLKETTHPVWPELDWVQTQLLPRLVQILLLLDVNAVPCVNSMSTVCYSLSTVFGRPFTVAKFVPLFKSKFSFDITATEGQDFNNSQFISVLNGKYVRYGGFLTKENMCTCTARFQLLILEPFGVCGIGR